MAKAEELRTAKTRAPIAPSRRPARGALDRHKIYVAGAFVALALTIAGVWIMPNGARLGLSTVDARYYIGYALTVFGGSAALLFVVIGVIDPGSPRKRQAYKASPDADNGVVGGGDSGGL